MRITRIAQSNFSVEAGMSGCSAGLKKDKKEEGRGEAAAAEVSACYVLYK